MDIKRNGTQPSGKGPAEWFTGTVRIDPLFKATYPAIEAKLEQLISDLERNEREIDFVNRHQLPTGAQRLQSAELIARGIGSWRVGAADVVRITEQLCLPAFKHDPHRPYAWPRSR